jgi:hypothetical protein
VSASVTTATTARAIIVIMTEGIDIMIMAGIVGGINVMMASA